ncbi:MAG: hypothetical protein HY904_22935 [Deltaproteobacteria bacterium]|nr:hypothetical protein [Deltaproteobacteria bacterium]
MRVCRRILVVFGFAMMLLPAACKPSPTCDDGQKNGDESDLDCGGSCARCLPGAACGGDADCVGLCISAVCRLPACGNARKDGDETDADCGGSCEPCAGGRTCVVGGDCASRVCANGACAAPSCNDQVANGDESDLDCGGSCAACGAGLGCNAAADCASGACVDRVCRPGHCEDGLRSGDETDVDCGGTCAACAVGRTCEAAGDCATSFCVTQTCRADSCSSGTRDGDETDVDCGGTTCRPCGHRGACAMPRDCTQGTSCLEGTCRLPCDATTCSGLGSCFGVGAAAVCLCPFGFVDDRAGGCRSAAHRDGVVLVGTGTPLVYRQGVDDPGSTWAAPDTVPDATWIASPDGFGIGYSDGDDRTILEDMRGAYATVYARASFLAGSEAAQVDHLVLSVAYDDGFVAYLNGVEVGRGGMGDGAPSFSTLAVASHSARSLRSVFVLSPHLLRLGENVFAVEVHNVAINNGDLSLIPRLSIHERAGRPGGEDADGDGLEDALEEVWGTDARDPDSDGDGLLDGEELLVDGDALVFTAGVDTDPLDSDSDGDIVSDGLERFLGGDPASESQLPLLPFLLGQTDGAGGAVFDKGTMNDTGAIGLSNPGELAVDVAAGHLFVADTDNHRVLVFSFDSSGAFPGRGATVALGQVDLVHGEADRGGAVGAGALHGPRGPAFFDDGTTKWLVVADEGNHRVLGFDVTVPRTGAEARFVLGQPDFTHHGENRGFGTTVCQPLGADGGTLATPKGTLVAVVGTRTLLFVADTDNNRVLAWNVTAAGLAGVTNGAAADFVIGQPDFVTRGSNACGSAGAATLDDPVGLAVQGTRLWVADSRNDRLVAYELGANAEALVATPAGLAAAHVLGQAGFTQSSSNRGGAAGAGTFSSPGQLAIDGGFLFAADRTNDRVMVYDVTGAITDGMDAVYVFGQADLATAVPGLSAAAFDSPRGVAALPAHRLFITDGNQHRLLAFDLSTFPADVVAGLHGKAAVDVLGQTAGGAAPLFDSAGRNDPGAAGLSAPSDAVFGTVGGRSWLFVADDGNHRVVALEADATGAPLDLVADHVVGAADLDHPGGAVGAAGFDRVTGLALDVEGGRLLVADAGRHRVTVFDVSSGPVDGAAAIAVLGQADFAGVLPNGGVAVSATGLSEPSRLGVGGRSLYVCDAANGRVLVFNLADGLVTHEPAVFVLGQPDLTSVGGVAGPTTLVRPVGVDVDTVGARVAVADAGGHRVVVYDVAAGLSNGPAAARVFGQDDLSSTAAGAGRRGLTEPTDVVIDAARGLLWVADRGNNRVLGFPLDATGAAPARLVLGQPGPDHGSAATGTGRMAFTTQEPTGLLLVGRRLVVVQAGDHRVSGLMLPGG